MNRVDHHNEPYHDDLRHRTFSHKEFAHTYRLRSFGPARLVSSPSVSIDEPVAADRRKAGITGVWQI